jgi:hypothetical protein
VFRAGDWKKPAICRLRNGLEFPVAVADGRPQVDWDAGAGQRPLLPELP